jgi:fumarate hydratase class II
MRTESDSMGTTEVYWGAQTARLLIHFNVGEDRMPPELIRAIGILKKAAALVNTDLGKLAKEKTQLIKARIDYFVSRSLMLVTALSPIVGYDRCAKIAHAHDLSLREANRALKFLSDEEFQKVVRPETMTKPDEA